MCIIIDANVASLVFAKQPSADFAPIFRWISSGNGRIVYGGRNAQELTKLAEARRLLLQFDRAGKAVRWDDKNVNAETARVEKSGRCRSDDPHVIALARLSKVRLLCSNDKELHADFTALLDTPKGKVYQNKSHVRLLRHTRGCPGSPTQAKGADRQSG